MSKIVVWNSSDDQAVNKHTEEAAWIVFNRLEEGDEQPENENSEALNSGANAIVFNEKTGEQLSEQLVFAPSTQDSPTAIALPWKSWHRGSRDLGAMEADMPAAVAVLHCMHDCFDVTLYDIDAMQADKSA